MTKKETRFLETEVNNQSIRELNLDKSMVKRVLRGHRYKTYYYEEVDANLYFKVKRPEWRYEKRRTRLFEKIKKGEIDIVYLDEIRLDDESDEKKKEEITSNISVEDIALKHLRDEAINEALNNLSSEERTIIKLIFYEELTERQISKIIGVSQKTVNNKKKKILEKLKKELKDYSNTF